LSALFFPIDAVKGNFSVQVRVCLGTLGNPIAGIKIYTDFRSRGAERTLSPRIVSAAGDSTMPPTHRAEKFSFVFQTPRIARRWLLFTAHQSFQHRRT
jgi:hypothetical protein